MGIVINKGGFFTTIQDMGRKGYRTYGVTLSGVMDERSAIIANYLVGNDKNESVIETTLLGPEIQFDSDNTFAITGGNSNPKLNGKEIPLYHEIQAKSGDVLTFSYMKEGCRNYIAFCGGLNLKKVMGSTSTLINSKIGGINGDKLKYGDKVDFNVTLYHHNTLNKTKREVFNNKDVKIRIIMGPEDDMFTEKGIETLLTTPYKIDFASNRMGYHLVGEEIEHKDGADIISNGMAFGAIEVPQNGQPIILMADRPTTGGYSKIANVISVDIPILAQCPPGTMISFEKCDVETAQKLYRNQMNELSMIISKC